MQNEGTSTFEEFVDEIELPWFTRKITTINKTHRLCNSCLRKIAEGY